MTHKTRPIKVVKDYLPHAEGSCLFSLGNTSVLCVATVEEKVPNHIEQLGIVKGWVTAEYSMLPRAGKERTPRHRGVGGGRSQEISRLIGRSLRSVVDLEKLGKRSIILDCDVLRADGGTRTAAINGAYIALFEAVKKLHAGDLVEEWPLRDYLGAISVGIVDGKRVLDLDYTKDSVAEVDMNVVMTGSGKMIEIQGTAEGKPFSRKDLDALVEVAASGIRSIVALQKKILGKIPCKK